MIFYFSGTGNSKYVADQLAFHCQDTVYSIADCLKNKQFKFHVQPAERVGFVMPTYFYGVPELIGDFVDRMTLVSAGGTHYVYHVLTCGSSTGNAGAQMREMLHKRGIVLSASFSIVMSDGYIPLLNPPTRSESIRQMQLAEVQMNQIIDDVLDRNCGDFNRHKGLIPAELWSSVTYPFYLNGRKTEKFHVTHACTHCGLCATICPVNAIELLDGNPIWVAQQCQFCMGCINRCPAQAIEYGKRTKNRNRYQNPWVKF